MSFASLKKNSKKDLDALVSDLEKLKTRSYDNDEPESWKPTIGKDGNGFAIIRFLPAPANEKAPFVRLWYHGFQGPGGWYINNSRTTLGEPDPMSEYNTILWDTGDERQRSAVRRQKRKLSYYSNILVIRDPGNPANEGKVFMFKYGQKIFDKIASQANPQYEGEEKVNVFNMWEGANFRMKVSTSSFVNDDGDKITYPNYDESTFDQPSAISDDDSVLESYYNSLQSLQELISEDKFKSYDELKKQMMRALRLKSDPFAGGPVVTGGVDAALAEKEPVVEESEDEDDVPFDLDDDDDDESFFDQFKK